MNNTNIINEKKINIFRKLKNIGSKFFSLSNCSGISDIYDDHLENNYKKKNSKKI